MIWGEAIYLEQLERIELDCRRLPPLLIGAAKHRAIPANSPVVMSIISTVESIVERCRRERENLGLWREDGLEPEEILDAIDDEIGALVERLEAFYPMLPATRTRAR